MASRPLGFISPAALSSVSGVEAVRSTRSRICSDAHAAFSAVALRERLQTQYIPCYELKLSTGIFRCFKFNRIFRSVLAHPENPRPFEVTASITVKNTDPLSLLSSNNGNGQGQYDDVLGAQKSKLELLIENEEANRPSFGERARTLITTCQHGVLSTLSEHSLGTPFGSYVDYVLDEECRPIFYLHNFAAHTKNLEKDFRCSLFLQPDGSIHTEKQKEARITVMGHAFPVPEDILERVREKFAQKHPHYTEIILSQNFAFYRMDIEEVFFVAGFGSAARWVSASDYAASIADPLYEEATTIVQCYNKDRAEDLFRLAVYFAGLNLAEKDVVTMTTIDRLGFDIRVKQEHETNEVRIPFVTPGDWVVEDAFTARSALNHMCYDAWSHFMGLDVDPEAVPLKRTTFRIHEDPEPESEEKQVEGFAPTVIASTEDDAQPKDAPVDVSSSSEPSQPNEHLTT
mmetsp:Transcript_5156/g.8904  ORF Transcript_5156/g.8904 Transcript_5156/m.8904 type:complete len:459 (-) Transcript_5156:1002-2378(-)|eukprot:CAMPEP_0196660402 /NCGR_PEP_ID=MMETSP1086-20130531/39604_1 /TAXON_ID=77921 /ORGANISM="Cyanoptyche  gloeocystis , Strain SAG4.97" /LENGTH=458 /DNA_ID=CAMNT_0041994797 /DNA_START=102 /DNA_END=1478 /DNA_ORIENTATION=+